MKLVRKLDSFFRIIRHARNWPSILCWRLGVSEPPSEVCLRSGVKIIGVPDVGPYWTSIFFTCIADVYRFRGQQPDSILDVGANIGSFSAFAGQQCPQARIIGFEPQTELAPQIRENCTINKLQNFVLVPEPITSDGRDVEFQLNVDNASASIFAVDGATGVQRRTSKPISSIDWGSAKSVFIKIDAEGVEGELIRWICESRAKLPTNLEIACEYHNFCPISLPELETMLKGAGFETEVTSAYGDHLLLAKSYRR